MDSQEVSTVIFSILEELRNLVPQDPTANKTVKQVFQLKLSDLLNPFPMSSQLALCAAGTEVLALKGNGKFIRLIHQQIYWRNQQH